MGKSQKQHRRAGFIRVLAGLAAATALSGFAVGVTTPEDSAQASTANAASGIGYYQPSNSSWHLSYSTPPGGGQSDRAFVFGPANSGGIVPVSGDWDGNGSSSVGWYRYSDASWHLTAELNGGTDISFLYGPAGDKSVVPVAGDWDGDGKDTVGWYRPSDASWHLASANSNSATSSAFVYGAAGNSSVTAIAGDWNGDGKDTVGWYRPSDGSWHLASANGNGATSTAFAWGVSGNSSVSPVAGDWNGDGKDTVGWYRPSDGSYHLTNSNAPGSASITFVFGPTGNSSLVPIAGDWDGRSTPSSSAQAVAKRLQSQYQAGKLTFIDGKAAIFEREILPYAQTGTAPAGCRVDVRILQALAMSVDHFGSIRVSDIGRPCMDEFTNCDFSLHCYDPAKAIDVIGVGGTTMSASSEAKRIEYVRYLDSIVPSGSQAGQFNCMPNRPAFSNIRSVTDTACHHQHFDLGSATGSVRYTG